MNKFYVTTAIDYVNASPHIGHAYEKIAADILARYHRLKGEDVFFLTGVDEHGAKVEKAAKKDNTNPQAYVDQIAAQFQDAWKSLNISYDSFIRTTEPRHAKSVQEMFKRLLDKGDIYKGSYSGLYCEGCEDYKRERDLDENGFCPNHKVAPFMFKEDNYFFSLTKYKDRIREWILANPDAVQPEGRRKEVLNQLDDNELGDFSVSRSRASLTWGIPVPGEDDQVIYVWLDALTNYVTGAGFGSDEKQMAARWPADLHLIGKDILKFHAIYWPAFLLSADLPLPKKIFAHGFINVEGQKMSKSVGNVIDPKFLAEKYTADALRYFLFAATPFDADGDFSKEEFISRVNADLANNLGNLLNRTLTLVDKYTGSKVPDLKADEAIDNTLREEANLVHTTACAHLEKLEYAKAIDAILALADQTNKYLNDEKPWTLFKDGKTKQGEVVLYTSLDMLRRVTILLYPFIPTLADTIWQQLGYSGSVADLGKNPEKIWDVMPPGQVVRNQGPIFKRIEESVVTA